MPDKDKFGMLGFHRLNGRDTSKKAYKRTHITSTVLLNLNKLKGIEYHWRAHVWEDLQFNRDVEFNRDELKRAVLCKCYRFAFSSPQIRQGGCADIVARRKPPETDFNSSDEVPMSDVSNGPASLVAEREGYRDDESRQPTQAEGSLDGPHTTVSTEESVRKVITDDSLSSEVAAYVRGLKKLENADACAEKFEEEEINGYAFLRLNDQDLKDLNVKFGPRKILLEEIASLHEG